MAGPFNGGAYETKLSVLFGTSAGTRLSLLGGEARALCEIYGVKMRPRKNKNDQASLLPPMHRVQRRACALTSRDQDILDALTLRIRILSIAQLSRWFWTGETDRRCATKSIDRLVRAGLLDWKRFLVGPEVELNSPLASWRQGETRPDWDGIVWRTRTRWIGRVTAMRCVVAAPGGAARYGVTSHPPRISEATHDLHVAQVFLRLRASNLERARRWDGEALRQFGRQPNAKVPDAIIRRAGTPLAIEVVGASYGANKLNAFHGYCESQGLSYELW